MNATPNIVAFRASREATPADTTILNAIDDAMLQLSRMRLDMTHRTERGRPAANDGYLLAVRRVADALYIGADKYEFLSERG